MNCHQVPKLQSVVCTHIHTEKNIANIYCIRSLGYAGVVCSPHIIYTRYWSQKVAARIKLYVHENSKNKEVTAQKKNANNARLKRYFDYGIQAHREPKECREGRLAGEEQ